MRHRRIRGDDKIEVGDYRRDLVEALRIVGRSEGLDLRARRQALQLVEAVNGLQADETNDLVLGRSFLLRAILYRCLSDRCRRGKISSSSSHTCSRRVHLRYNHA